MLKNKSTQSQVPPDFCSDLVNILEYWKANETIYREQDRQLTNIYEDLSGAVRVYIRIKPLPKSESATNTLTLYSPNNKKTKSLFELNKVSQTTGLVIKKVFTNLIL